MMRLFLLVERMLYIPQKSLGKNSLKKVSQWIEKIKGAEIEVLLIDWT